MTSGRLTGCLKNNDYGDKKKKTTDKTKKEMAAQPKKLSPAGEWMRKHPHGLEGIVINDQSILYD